MVSKAFFSNICQSNDGGVCQSGVAMRVLVGSAFIFLAAVAVIVVLAVLIGNG